MKKQIEMFEEDPAIYPLFYHKDVWACRMVHQGIEDFHVLVGMDVVGYAKTPSECASVYKEVIRQRYYPWKDH